MAYTKPMLLLSIMLCYSHICTSMDTNWPILLFQPGEEAHLPCIPHGVATAHFWRKGDVFNNSEPVAYKFEGHTSQSEDKWKDKVLITNDGTLIINNVSPSDEGKYFCRIVSESTDCNAGVSLQLQVLVSSKSPRTDAPVEVYTDPLTDVCDVCDASSSSGVWIALFVVVFVILVIVLGINCPMYHKGKSESNREQWSQYSQFLSDSGSVNKTDGGGGNDDKNDGDPEKQTLLPKLRRGFVIMRLKYIDFLKAVIGTLTVEKEKQANTLREAMEKIALQMTGEDYCEISKNLTEVGEWIYLTTSLQDKISGLNHLTTEVEKISFQERSLEEKDKLDEMVKSSKEIKIAVEREIHTVVSEIREAESKDEIQKVLTTTVEWQTTIKGHVANIPGIEDLTIKKLLSALEEKVNNISNDMTTARQQEIIFKALTKIGAWSTAIQDDYKADIPELENLTINKLKASFKQSIADASTTLRNAGRKEEIQKDITDALTVLAEWHIVINNHHKNSIPGLENVVISECKATLENEIKCHLQKIKESHTEEAIQKSLEEIAARDKEIQAQANIPHLEDVTLTKLRTALEENITSLSKQIEESKSEAKIGEVLTYIGAWHKGIQDNHIVNIPDLQNLTIKKLKSALQDKITALSEQISKSETADNIANDMIIIGTWRRAHRKTAISDLQELTFIKLETALQAKVAALTTQIEKSQTADEIGNDLVIIGKWRKALTKATIAEEEKTIAKALETALHNKITAVTKQIEKSETSEQVGNDLVIIGKWRAALTKPNIAEEEKTTVIKALETALHNKITAVTKQIEKSETSEQIGNDLVIIGKWRAALTKPNIAEEEKTTVKKLEITLQDKISILTTQIEKSEALEEIENDLKNIDNWIEALAKAEGSSFEDLTFKTLKEALKNKTQGLTQKLSDTSKNLDIQSLPERINLWINGVEQFKAKSVRLGDVNTKELKQALEKRLENEKLQPPQATEQH